MHEMFTTLEHGLTGRALKQGIARLHHHPLRQFSTRKDGRIDDRPLGGGPGMIIQAEPIYRAKQAVRNQSPDTIFIFMDPKGEKLTQATLQALSQEKTLAIICGRYEGIDERAYDDNDQRLSLGDYITTGGELPAMVLMDAIIRLLPNTLGNQNSHSTDSFSDGLLDYPCYTQPANWRDHHAPDVLQSGNHQAIAKWRHQQKLGLTWQRRSDLIDRSTLSSADKRLLKNYLKEL